MATTRRKVLVDCDPGIDDSLALLFLFSQLKKTNCDLVGVTIVHGNNPDLQIMKKNAHLLLSSFGFEGVEVVAGASDPLTRPYAGHQGMLWHGQNGLGDITNANEILKNNNNSPTPTTTTTTNNNNTNNQAAIFMNEQAKKQQGELEVICLGPLTNLGCCLQVFGEEFIVNVKRVNLMGGMVRTLNPGGNVSPLAEANVFNDPEAADCVFSSPWRNPLRIVPLDITEKTRISYEKLGQFKEMDTKAGNFIWSIIQFYHRRYETVREEQEKERKEKMKSVPASHAHLFDSPFSDTWEQDTIPTHDSSAIMATFFPEVYKWKPVTLKVLNNNDVSRGMCVAYPPASPFLITKKKEKEGKEVFLCNICEVAWEVDANQFLSIFFENLGQLE